MFAYWDVKMITQVQNVLLLDVNECICRYLQQQVPPYMYINIRYFGMIESINVKYHKIYLQSIYYALRLLVRQQSLDRSGLRRLDVCYCPMA